MNLALLQLRSNATTAAPLTNLMNLLAYGAWHGSIDCSRPVDVRPANSSSAENPAPAVNQDALFPS